MTSQVKTGTLVAAGAAINVSLGWKPDYVKVFNVTDGTVYHEWVAGMAAGTSIKTDLAAATQGSNGISPFNGTLTATAGFTIGTAIALNGKTLAYVAMREKP